MTVQRWKIVVWGGLAALVLVVGLIFNAVGGSDRLAGAIGLNRTSDTTATGEQVSRRTSAASAPSPQDPGRIKQVTVVMPTAGGGSLTTTQPASVHSFGIVDLYAKVSGYLTNQSVDIGDRVKKGQIIAEIDAPEIVSAEQRAAAMLEKAKANVIQMTATIDARQADLKAAEANQAQRKPIFRATRPNSRLPRFNTTASKRSLI